jgi:transketolase
MASKVLEEQKLKCRVISMHTVKPLDAETILRAARNSRALITVEEHSVSGGLGEACAAVLAQAGLSLPFRIVGLPDEYTITGSQLEIFNHYGISAQGLADTAEALLNS